MNESAFSHLILWQHPMASLCFFAYAMSFLCLWIRQTWLWSIFFLIAYALALDAKIVQWVSLIPVVILFLCHYFLKGELQRGPRFLFFGVAIMLSLALAFHLMPGFNNWQLASNLHLSPRAYPYSLWLNFDKPLIGIFVLALSLPLINSREHLLRVLKVSIPLSILGILIMIGISLHIGLVQWDPKIPVISLLWLIDNLIFVSIPEEAFFRGFIQRELYHWFGKNGRAALASIFVTSIFFSLLHLIWVTDFSFICLVFTASLIYGVIYQWTKAIEASILCHFGLNVTHFFLFTYPALQA